eukprot:4940737-Pleurochrysis_carterae.AAC.1
MEPRRRPHAKASANLRTQPRALGVCAHLAQHQAAVVALGRVALLALLHPARRAARETAAGAEDEREAAGWNERLRRNADRSARNRPTTGPKALRGKE